MSERFDALMIELSEELSAMTLTDGDEQIRLSPVERGDRLEVLSDRLATRCVELETRVQILTLALALMEQEDVIRAQPHRWVCSRCGAHAIERTAVKHTNACPFSLVDGQETPPVGAP